MKKVYLYGASGHGKVVKEIIESNGDRVEAFIDDNCCIDEFVKIPVFHSAEECSPMIVSIGVNHIRERIVKRLHCNFATYIHPTAIISPSAKIGEGTVIMAGAIVNADAVIGKHCIINTGATIDHDVLIEDFVHIAPGVNVSGGTHIGRGTWVGVGSCVIQCLCIGKNCMIGAGSVVVRNLPDGVTAYGNPCRVK